MGDGRPGTLLREDLQVLLLPLLFTFLLIIRYFAFMYKLQLEILMRRQSKTQ